MKHYWWLYLIPIGFIFFSSCKQEPKPIAKSNKKEVVKSKFAQYYPEFNPKDLQNRLKDNLSTTLS